MSAPALPPAVQELVLRAELHARSVAEALGHYETALEALNAHIQGLQAGSAGQAALIQQFKGLLTAAEQLKQQQQADPPAAEYTWRQRQAQRLAEQAVTADGQGQHDVALESYFQLLECLNRCHALERVPACQAAIMTRFQVYLERAEVLRRARAAHKGS